MMKKDKTVFVPVRLPSINSRPSTQTSKTSIARPSSQPRNNASNLQKILFEKLNDYDGILRKQKRQEKLQKKPKLQSSSKSQTLGTKIQNKKPIMKIEDIKERTKQIKQQKNIYSLKEIKPSKKQQQSDQTFLTANNASNSMTHITDLNNIDTDQFLKTYENYKYECTEEQLQQYLQSVNMSDYNIQYTQDKELKQMRKCLTANQNQLQQLQKSMNKMIKMIGQSVIPKDIQDHTIEEQSG